MLFKHSNKKQEEELKYINIHLMHNWLLFLYILHLSCLDYRVVDTIRMLLIHSNTSNKQGKDKSMCKLQNLQFLLLFVPKMLSFMHMINRILTT
jgi:hypothetical protein